MAKKKKTYVKKPFESTGVSSDTSANLYESMLTSDVWKALSPQQKILYLACKAQYYGEKRRPRPVGIDPNEEQEYFTMNRAKYCGKYGLYKDSNRAGFHRDMDALIAHGFIICIESGKYSRTKSVYRYSNMWQFWGTPEFNVPMKHMTTSGIKKANQSKLSI